MYQGQRNKKTSKQQEERLAEDLGGRTVAGSGAPMRSGGGDVRLQGKLRIEAKYTSKDSYSLHIDDLKKIEEQAIRAGEIPLFVVQFKIKPIQPSFVLYKISNEEALDQRMIIVGNKSIKLKMNQLLSYNRLGGAVISFSGVCYQVMSWERYKEERQNAGD
jgi:hypothetical protein